MSDNRAQESTGLEALGVNGQQHEEEEEEEQDSPGPGVAPEQPSTRGGQKRKRTPTWDDHYQALLQYKATEGHCNVACSHENKQLAYWVDRQRFFRFTMSQERKAKLDAIGFTWSDVRQDRSDILWNQVRNKHASYISILPNFD